MARISGIKKAGNILAGPVQLSAQFDILALGTTITDVTSQSISVPASSVPVILVAKYEINAITGTAAQNSVIDMALFITDSANTALAADVVTFKQTTAGVTETLRGKFYVELYLPAPVAAATYKLRAKLLAAAPANWTSAKINPGYSLLASPNNNFRAHAA